MKEDNRTKIAVASYEQASLLVSHTKQVNIGCSRQAKLRNRHNIMPQFLKEADRACVYVLVSQESHDVVATWMSSTVTTSMAY